MASLADTIKSRSGLAQASSEELAAQAGRAPSRQPLETAVLGGTPDQAKMAGTPAQKTAALRTNIQGQEDLATRLRRNQVRREATSEEAGQMEKAGKLQQLGSLDERVQQLAEQRIAEATGQTGEVQIQAQQEDQEMNNLLNVLSDPNATTEQQNTALFQINKKLGKNTIDEMLTAAEVQGMFGRAEEQIADNLVLDAIEAGELDLQGMGFENAEELSGLIGADVSQMTISELLDQVNAAIEQEYSQVEDLKSRINDPRLGPAERAEARAQLREMGAVGIRSAETDLEEMADAIEQADTVEYAGQEIQVEELLGDEYMSGLIKEYLLESDDAGNPTSPWAEDFKADHPELVKFISEHQNILTQAMGDIGDDVANLAKIQEQNQSFVNLPHGGQLPEGIAEIIFPDWGEMRDTAYVTENPDGSFTFAPELANNTVIKSLYNKDIPEDERETLRLSLKNVVAEAPVENREQFIKEFMELSEDQLIRLGAMNHNSVPWQNFQERIGQRNAIDKISPGDDNAVARMFNVGSAAEFKEMVDNLSKAINFGTVDPSELPDIPGMVEFDANGNIIKSADFGKMLQWMKEEQRPGTLQELMDGPAASLGSLYREAKALSKLPPELRSQPKIIQDIFKGNKNISGYWATELTKQGFGPEEYGNILETFEDKMSDRAREKLTRAFTNTFMPKAADTIAKSSEFKNLKGLIDAINNDTIKDIKTADKVMGELEALKEIPGSDALVDEMTKRILAAKKEHANRELKRIQDKKAEELNKKYGTTTKLGGTDEPRRYRNEATGEIVTMRPSEMENHLKAMSAQGTVAAFTPIDAARTIKQGKDLKTTILSDKGTQFNSAGLPVLPN